MLSQFSASGLHHPPYHGGGAIWPGVPEPSAAGKQQKTNLKRPVAQLPPGLSVSIDLNLQVLALRLSVGLTA